MEHPALRTLNDSGFPLQIAVHRCIDETRSKHGWRVKYSEHAWMDHREGKSGFLDLVLQNEYGTSYIAVECKRPRHTEWVFLHSEGSMKSRAHAQGWVSFFRGGSMPRFGWLQLELDPTCAEAQFCAVRGQAPGDRIALIEKTAAELTLATECLALEHKDYRHPTGDDLKMFFSVIVTTAKLMVANFDPAAISLQDGTLSDAKFESVPFVRFRKQLGVHHSLFTPKQYLDGGDLAYLKESTVFVVNAEAICSFLTDFKVRSSGFFS